MTSNNIKMENELPNYSIERHKLKSAARASSRRRSRAWLKRADSLLLCLTFIGCICSFARASGVFELELIKLESSLQPPQQQQQRTITTSNSSSSSDNQTNDRPADLMRVFVCLKEAFTSQLDGPCTFGNASIILNQDSNQTGSSQAATAGQQQQLAEQQQGSLLTNLVRIPITFKWTKSFTIILSVEQQQQPPPPPLAQHQRQSAPAPAPADNQQPPASPPQQPQARAQASPATVASLLDESELLQLQQQQQRQPSLLDRHVLTENEVIPDLEINSPKAWTSRFSRGLKSSLAYRFRLYCALHYYGDGCNTFCRARDDQFGHYRCSPSGQKVCLEGWQGDQCAQARCRAGCSSGQCERPDTCKCRSGWTGDRCDQCLTYPGCRNGYCLSPGQCLCRTNWGGVLCDQELNYCGTHEPCKNNATCQNVAPARYKCNCPDGFTGVNCDLNLNAAAAAAAASSSSHQQQQFSSTQLSAGCALNPCLNGGICYGFDHGGIKLPPASINRSAAATSAGRYYRCQCSANWTGDYCQWPAAAIGTTELSSQQLSASATAMNENGGGGDTGGELAANYSTAADASLLALLESAAIPQTISPTAASTDDASELTMARMPPAYIESAGPAMVAAGPVMDMKHIISGVVVASAIGVFMAALLLAWCCLAAFERYGFSFVQMNIIRSAEDGGAPADCQPAAARATLRRVQEKIRNSFRRSSRRHIKPETKLSIENVLRAPKPPPTYEESNYLTLDASNLNYGVLMNHYHQDGGQFKKNLGPDLSIRDDSSESSPPAKAPKNLVIRGAIEQKLSHQATNNKSQATSANSNTITSAQHQTKTTTTTTTRTFNKTTRLISAGQLNCPKHGHLYRQNKHQHPSNLSGNLIEERDLKISYPSEVAVIRAHDLYEDHHPFPK